MKYVILFLFLVGCASQEVKPPVISCKMQCSENDQIVDDSFENVCACKEKPKSKELKSLELLHEKVDALLKIMAPGVKIEEKVQEEEKLYKQEQIAPIISEDIKLEEPVPLLPLEKVEVKSENEKENKIEEPIKQEPVSK
jgi:hypothetical protein